MSRPTAEETIEKIIKFESTNDTIECTVYSLSQVMIEFAKLHVEAALKKASEDAKVSLADDWVRKQETIHPGSLVSSITIKVDNESILNSYPLTNIK
jgi:hypothetical protein